jgi:hypothetical protein
MAGQGAAHSGLKPLQNGAAGLVFTLELSRFTPMRPDSGKAFAEGLA